MGGRMKEFSLKPHEIGYLKLIYSTFAGLDYATANAAELLAFVDFI